MKPEKRTSKIVGLTIFLEEPRHKKPVPQGVKNVLAKGVHDSATSHEWRQYYTCFAISLLSISKGLCYGWSSPMIQALQRKDSPVGPMDEIQIGLLQTIFASAKVVGLIISPTTLYFFGTKATAYVFSSICFFGFILIDLAESTTTLYIGRFLTGSVVFGVDAVSTFFLSEIAQDSIRGSLISYSLFAGNLGTLLAFILGVFCSYKQFNIVCTVFPILFIVFFFIVPESPFHFVRMKRTEDAMKSYFWYHGVDKEAAHDYIAILNQSPKITANFRKFLSNQSNRKALIVLSFLIGFTQFAGTFVINSFTSDIFEKTGGNVDPNQSAVFVAFMTFAGSLVSALLIDCTGRKVLLIASLIIMSLNLYTVTGYFFAKNYGWTEAVNYAWLVYGNLGCYAAASAIGITSVSRTIGTEMVPESEKMVLWLLSAISSYIVSVLTTQAYSLITTNLSYYINFLQQAVFATLTVLIAWRIVPETKNKSQDEITAELSGHKTLHDLSEKEQKNESLEKEYECKVNENIKK